MKDQPKLGDTRVDENRIQRIYCTSCGWIRIHTQCGGCPLGIPPSDYIVEEYGGDRKPKEPTS